MGWRYQHDIKVKKVWKAVALTAAVLGLCSCKMDPTHGALDNYDIIEGDSSQKVNVWNKGDVFLADYNYTHEWYSFNTLPKVKKIKNRIIEEEPVSNNIAKFNNPNDYYSSILDERNQKLFEQMQLNRKSRSVDDIIINCEVKKITATVGDKKNFWSFYDEALEIPEEREAECKYIGKNCIIWNIPVKVGEEFPPEYQLSEEVFKKIADKFDYIYDLETSFLGTHQYTKKYGKNFIDSHDKIEIILTDICGDAAQKKELRYVGYFSSNDVYKKIQYDGDGNRLTIEDKSSKNYGKDLNFSSNETQCIFIDSPYYFEHEYETYSTIVHEFQHLLNFCYKQQFGGFSNRWFTEMMSMLAEDAFSDYLDLELIDTPQVRLVNWIMDYGYLESPFIWYDLSQTDLIGKSYSATYALGAFLSRNYGGLELIHELATCEFVDIDALEYALNKVGYSYDKVYKSLNSFNTIISNMPYTMINIDKNDGEDISTINKNGQEEYITLNRGWTSSKYKDLTLNPICIKQKYEIVNSNGEKKYLDVYPIYLNTEKSYSPSWKLYYGGFALWYVGNNVKKFNIEVPEKSLGFYKVLYPQGQ